MTSGICLVACKIFLCGGIKIKVVWHYLVGRTTFNPYDISVRKCNPFYCLDMEASVYTFNCCAMHHSALRNS